MHCLTLNKSCHVPRLAPFFFSGKPLRLHLTRAVNYPFRFRILPLRSRSHVVFFHRQSLEVDVTVFKKAPVN